MTTTILLSIAGYLGFLLYNRIRIRRIIDRRIDSIMKGFNHETNISTIQAAIPKSGNR